MKIQMIHPPNGIILVSGGGEIDVPAEDVDPNRHLVAASPSALLVCVLSEVDGETEFTFGASRDVDPGWPVGFVGQIDTPFREILVETVDDKVLVRQAVQTLRASLRIWFSHPVFPDRVLIGFD